MCRGKEMLFQMNKNGRGINDSANAILIKNAPPSPRHDT